MKPLEDFLTPTQDQLFTMLCAMFKGKTKVCKGKYILVKGEAPIMLLAHLDTVHKEPVKDICKSKGGTILMSPQGIGGDDRCGVYALCTVYEQAPVKPWLLFTCDEEIGGHGAEAFCGKYRAGKLPKALDEIKMLIEIDRKGKNDAVYYDCDNKDFEKYITSKGFKTDWGSFSDISVIAPEMGIAAVNLSSGYYNAHTLHEYINRRQINATAKKVLEIVADAVKKETPKYEYVEAFYGGRYGGYYSGWSSKGTQLKVVPVVDDPELLGVPKEIREEYAALLDYYSEDELEEIRAEFGDNAIVSMFQSEFGASYDDLFGAVIDDDDWGEDVDLRCSSSVGR